MCCTTFSAVSFPSIFQLPLMPLLPWAVPASVRENKQDRVIEGGGICSGRSCGEYYLRRSEVGKVAPSKYLISCCNPTTVIVGCFSSVQLRAVKLKVTSENERGPTNQVLVDRKPFHMRNNSPCDAQNIKGGSPTPGMSLLLTNGSSLTSPTWWARGVRG